MLRTHVILSFNERCNSRAYGESMYNVSEP